MSFFGFDPMAAPKGKPETVDFNDLEDDDAFNEDTFGSAAVSNLNQDFDFSNGGVNSKKSSLKPAPIPEKTNVSYAAAAHSNIDSMLKPMASLWMDESSNVNKTNEGTSSVPSLQEIEAKLKSQNLQGQGQGQAPLAHMQQQNMNMGQGQPPNNVNMNMNMNMNMQVNPQFQLPPYITQMLYQPSIQQQIYSAVSSGRFPNLQTATQAMIQMLLSTPNPMMQMHPQFSAQNGIMNPNMNQMIPQNIPQQSQSQPQPQTQNQIQSQQQAQQQVPPHSQPQPQTQPLSQGQQVEQPHTSVQSPNRQADKTIDMNDFPSIEVASAKSNGHVNHSEPVFSNEDSDDSSIINDFSDNMHNGRRNHQNQHYRSHGYNQGNNQRGQTHRYGGHNDHHNFQRQHQLQDQLNQMSPEERENFLIRQRKVSTITRCSGFMTPKDKDFVTRFQLSQIVTDDPYNEDFYSQVYKAINSNNNNNMNSLAQKYLEQSGHRLGGRSKRADVALQRMQQQVSKAVSVAKERGANTGILTKAGALGKVSYGSGKQPRKQLIIPTESTNENSNEADAPDAPVELSEVVIPKEYSFSKSARTFQLSIIEKIYNEVLKLESLERENEQYETIELWKSLHIKDVIKTSSNEVVNPFISILAFDKMMKVFGRTFHLLTETQKETLVGLFFEQLQNIDVIRNGSYKNYVDSNYLIPKDIIKKIDLFQVTVLNNLVIYISEASFSKVLSWFKSLVDNKTTLFLSTTKIGLSIITVLISRLELIKQEISEKLSAHELSQWQTVYNEMFESLEGRLVYCFPPYLSHDESIKVTNEQSDEDDSYIWQFLASLTLTGKLNHQRVIVDEIRGEIFGVMAACKEYKASGDFEKASRYMNNLNLFLNAMGLIATEDDITQLGE